ncbi:putative ATP-sensitive inward rectifier potassium channel 12-like [Apostichopus japonicus]|uniref:Putative ATP-sensitive inward rectifier potassium channel 12-like n=1 Tax=Stichopus japonicus TaxID=307972 RepID=A0A2G8KN97_STIJA|nr:putative ATP-sensitive inward rectifier potassium channel 12-like [Apostichopus japonicus]
MSDFRHSQSLQNTSFCSEANNHSDLNHLVKLNHQSTNHVDMTSHIGSSNLSIRSSPVPGKSTRLITKRGNLNVEFDSRVRCWIFRYLRDIFTTSVDLPWRYNILFVSACFLCSWLFFGAIYYVIVLLRGDLANLDNPDWRPCFRNFYDWKSALLYSIEAQTTIGFGFRSPTEKCGEAIFVLILQTLCAQFMEAFVIGTFIGKFSRPKLRANTLMFSKQAVINREDGKLVFSFRVGDLRVKSPIVEGHVRLHMLRHHITKEGSFFPYRVFDMNIGHDTGLDRVFLVWPLLVTHVIDEESPLYDISREDLSFSEFEIVAIFEGIVEATGTTTQLRTSYLPHEILWGQEFDNIIYETNGRHFVDFKRFHTTRLLPGFSGVSAKAEKEQRDMTENTEMRGPVWQERPPDIERVSLHRNSTLRRHTEVESRL